MGKRGGRKNRGKKRDGAEAGGLSLRAGQNDAEERVTTSLLEDSGDGEAQTSRVDAMTIPAPLCADWFSNKNEDKKNEKYVYQWQKAWRRLASKWSPHLNTPSTIQRHVWPILLSDRNDEKNQETEDSVVRWWNIIALAPTGQGKTLAFGAPLLLEAIQSSSQSDKKTSKGDNKNKANLQLKQQHTLILLPTRELVQQVAREMDRAARSLSDNNRLAILTLHGGVDRDEQVKALMEAHFVKKLPCLIASTPGRLIDLCTTTGTTKEEKDDAAKMERLLNSIQSVVLDEADRLAGNKDLAGQVDTLLHDHVKAPFRIGLFSATWPEKVTAKWKEWIQTASSSLEELCPPCAVVKVNSEALADSRQVAKKQKLNEPDAHDASNKDASPENKDAEDQNNDSPENGKVKHQWSKIPSHITQTVHVCAEHKKPRKLMGSLKQLRQKDKHQRQPSLGIVFFSTIKSIQLVAKLLRKEGVQCVELHSQMSQSSRERNVQSFKCGKIPLLLATDIAARGLHINGIRFVINYDFPGNLEDYVHRVGRAGRDGKAATVFSYFTRNLAPLASDMISLLQSSGQWCDPNLEALVKTRKAKKTKSHSNSIQHQATKSQSSQRKTQSNNLVSNQQDDDEMKSDDDDDDDMSFPALALNRIVLQRASHVSDPSSDSDSGDDG